jgi:hypothetical protein
MRDFWSFIYKKIQGFSEGSSLLFLEESKFFKRGSFLSTPGREPIKSCNEPT